MPVTRNGSGVKLNTRKKFRVDVDNVSGGVNTLVSPIRLDKNEAVALDNMWLIEDGVPDKRPGTEAYGNQTFANRPDGAAEYTKTDSTRELIVVADGKVYRLTTTSKTEITGATFTQGKRAYFLQYNDLLYIANGTDALARYNGSTLSTYSGISTPTWDGTPITRTGLVAGSYTYYYRVSALNDIGETLAAAEQSITTDKPREDWDSSNYLTLAWDDVSGATKYNIYFSDTSGFSELLSESVASTYDDDGTAVPNPYVEVPDADTTVGPKFGPMAVIGNRIWATGDPVNKYRVFFSGVGVNKGNFAPSYGGGWVDLEKGGEETTVAVEDYQGKAHIWTKTADGRGSIWQVSLDVVTIESTSFTVPIPTKIIGSVGCDSSRGVVKIGNDVLFANKQGIYVLGNEPGIQGVLRTNEVSSKIRPTWRALDGDSLDKIASFEYKAKVYFAVSTAAGEPDQIMIFDRERAAFMPKWTIGVSQFVEFTESDGTTKLLGITSNKLVEVSDSYEGDEGSAFTWTYQSPRFPVDKDWSKFADLMRSFIRLRNAVGSISFTISGTGRTNAVSSIATATITPGSSNSALGWDEFGSIQLGDTDGTPVTFSTESLIKYLRVKAGSDLLRDVQFKVSGDSLADRGIITGLSAEGFESNVPLPLSDQL